MTPLLKTLGVLLLFAVMSPWYSCGLASQHDDNRETSGEEPLSDPLPDPSSPHCQRNKNPKGLGFIGVKYNLLRGNPEGKTEMGGVDPGLEITRKILKLTYDDGKAVPDQICYEPRQVCSVSKSAKIFGGTKRYQEKLNVDVTAKGKSVIPTLLYDGPSLKLLLSSAPLFSRPYHIYCHESTITKTEVVEIQ